jgi:VanZ family protein
MRVGAKRAVAAAALTIQAMALFVPRTPQVDTGGLPLDKIAHTLLFATATATVIWAGARARPTVALMSLYAGISEVAQGALYTQRSGDIGDALADLIGVAIGAWLGLRWADGTPQDTI